MVFPIFSRKATGRTRTGHLIITSDALYRMSYSGIAGETIPYFFLIFNNFFKRLLDRYPVRCYSYKTYDSNGLNPVIFSVCSIYISTIRMDKKTIRKRISERKKKMTCEEVGFLSSQLTEFFCRLEEYQQAECLFAYLSFNQEVQTDEIIRHALAQGKRVAVPRVHEDTIRFYYITSLEQDCRPGYLGIREPADGLETADGKEMNVLMLMPGLAFDRTGGRVGYGKGFYDRYLASAFVSISSASIDDAPKVRFWKVALCYDFQIVEQIDAEPHDIRADLLISAPADCPKTSFSRSLSPVSAGISSVSVIDTSGTESELRLPG